MCACGLGELCVLGVSQLFVWCERVLKVGVYGVRGLFVWSERVV